MEDLRKKEKINNTGSTILNPFLQGAALILLVHYVQCPI